jgi:putative transposase
MHDEAPRSRQDISFKPHRLQGFDYRNADHAYFVTICAQSGNPFTDEHLAQEVMVSLQWLRAHRDVILYAYCLMPNHLHLLLRSGDESRTLGTVMGAFKTFTTRQSWKLGYKGVLWQARFYDHIMRRSEDGRRIATYILENPVRKGLVAEADAWIWSGRPDPM